MNYILTPAQFEMCFSERISLVIGLTGIASSLFIYARTNNVPASIGLLYFALMEIIQYFQYKVIDRCGNKYNRYLTILGYIHICFQPLFFNLWLFAFTVKPIVQYLYMSFFGGLLLASRLFYATNKNLCDPRNEPLCGKQTCAVSGERHIAWNLRLRATDWVTPSISLHFFLWIFPALSMFQLKPLLAVLLSGPYFGYLLTNNIHERPAIWCYTFVIQVIITCALLLR
jgi:hypothetical protein